MSAETGSITRFFRVRSSGIGKIALLSEGGVLLCIFCGHKLLYFWKLLPKIECCVFLLGCTTLFIITAWHFCKLYMHQLSVHVLYYSASLRSCFFVIFTKESELKPCACITYKYLPIIPNKTTNYKFSLHNLRNGLND